MAIDLNEMQNSLTHWGTGTILRPIPGSYRKLAYLIKRQGELCVAKTTRRSEADAAELLLTSWEIAVCWLVAPEYARRLAKGFCGEVMKNA
jgi:hypothetical protein